MSKGPVGLSSDWALLRMTRVLTPNASPSRSTVTFFALFSFFSRAITSLPLTLVKYSVLASMARSSSMVESLSWLRRKGGL